jgi:hypothetical protein
MEDSRLANDPLWDAYLRANAARIHLERRAWRKSFLLAVALIAMTLAGATALARLGGPYDSSPMPHSDPVERITAQLNIGN